MVADLINKTSNQIDEKKYLQCSYGFKKSELGLCNGVQPE